MPPLLQHWMQNGQHGAVALCTSIIKDCSNACLLSALLSTGNLTLGGTLCRPEGGQSHQHRAHALPASGAHLVNVVHDAEEAAALRARALTADANILGGVVWLRGHLHARNAVGELRTCQPRTYTYIPMKLCCRIGLRGYLRRMHQGTMSAQLWTT